MLHSLHIVRVFMHVAVHTYMYIYNVLCKWLWCRVLYLGYRLAEGGQAAEYNTPRQNFRSKILLSPLREGI
ncbi:MAG: hypothetical protein RLZZ367_411 [Bacteroidota bacterium]|jgi:hypothetical protein